MDVEGLSRSEYKLLGKIQPISLIFVSDLLKFQKHKIINKNEFNKSVKQKENEQLITIRNRIENFLIYLIF